MSHELIPVITGDTELLKEIYMSLVHTNIDSLKTLVTRVKDASNSNLFSEFLDGCPAPQKEACYEAPQANPPTDHEHAPPAPQPSQWLPHSGSLPFWAAIEQEEGCRWHDIRRE